MSVVVSRFNNSPIASSCYLVKDEKSGRILVVDPGSEDMSPIINIEIEKSIDKIILTHEHFDHISGCNYLFERFNTPILCSSYCAEAIIDAKNNMSLFYEPPGFVVKNDLKVINNYNTLIKWYGNQLIFYESHGHSIGGICFTIGEYLFTGDSLIENVRTVTKLKNGSKEKLVEFIKLLESLKGNGYVVCPGHGEMFNLDTYDISKALK